MKKLLACGLAAPVFLCLFLMGCTKDTTAPESPETASVPAFETTYRYPAAPFYEGQMEAGQLDEGNAIRHNRPVLATLHEVLEDVIAGKLKTSPIDPEGILQKEATDPEFALRMMERVTGQSKQVDPSLTQGFEVRYEARKSGEQVQWNATQLRIVYMDPNHLLPDMNLFQVSVDQLEPYRVQVEGQSVSLPTYLNQRQLEGYPIQVESALDTIRVRSLEEAFKFDALMKDGKTDALRQES